MRLPRARASCGGPIDRHLERAEPAWRCAVALACVAWMASCDAGSSDAAPPSEPPAPQVDAPSDAPPPEIAAYALQPGESLDVIESFPPDGKPLLRREVLRDADGLVNHGKFERWHPNGMLAERGYYLRGQKHGTYLVAADTGLKESEVSYRFGVPDGVSTTWNNMGLVKERAVYVDGKLEGEIERNVGTNPKERGRYEHGLEVGPWTYWFPAGGKQAEGEFIAGKRTGTWRTWFPEGGGLESEGRFEAGLEQGDWVYYFPTGGKQAEGSFEAGKRTGVWRTWHQWHLPDTDGLQSEETYRNGVLDGPAVELDVEGRKTAERTYAGGVPDGKQVEYYPDGKPQAESLYSAGKLEGLMRRWFADGTLQVEGTMRDGKRDGRWSYFNPDGTVNEAWTGEYRDDVRVSG